MQNQNTQDPGSKQPQQFNVQRMAPFILIPLLFVVPMLFTWMSGTRVPTVPYSFFLSQLRSGNVESVQLQDEEITGRLNSETTYRDETGATTTVVEFQTYVPRAMSTDYLEQIHDQNVVVTTLPTQDNSGWAILLNLLPFVLLVWIFMRVNRSMRQQGGGFQNMFNVGKNKAKKYEKTDSSVTFKDVAGAESAKVELAELVDFLKNPERFHKIGAETPHGVLMVGPPGAGKTLLAKAVAGEADVPFFSISGSDFVEMFVGVGASRVRDLFKDARESSPSIIFIDELDSIGRQRGAGLGGGHDEREQTLNQLLSEMDGFSTVENVIVLAATNRPDVLDPAILRPGRFDRRVTVPAPAVRDRAEILKIHAKKRPMADDVDLDTVAQSTSGFSGADLANLLNEASLLAARFRSQTVTQEHILQARDKILLGLKRSGVVMSDEERRTVAYHEAGHALVAAKLPNAEPVHKVTIVPRERAMGVTQQLPEGDRYLFRQDYITDRLAVMMGGRAAEAVKNGIVTTGAENDLKEAQKLARRMVLDWGMSSKFVNMAFGSDRREVFLGSQIGHQKDYSDSTTREIDEEVRGILEEAYRRTEELLRENEETLDKLAERLLEQDELSREEIEQLIGDKN